MKSMFEKIKEFGLYLVTPIVFIAGVVYYLITKNTSLKTEISILKSGKEIENAKDDANEKEKQANDAVSNYESVRDKYLNEHKE